MSCSGSSTLSTYAVMSMTSTAYSSSHSCVGVPGGGGGGGVPVESRPRDVGQVMLEGRPVLGGPVAGFLGGVVAPQGVGQVQGKDQRNKFSAVFRESQGSKASCSARPHGTASK